MINTDFRISGTSFNDYTQLNLTKAISDNLASSNFVANFDTPYGRHKSDFNVGQEITFYADSGASPITKQFTGILEEVIFTGEGLDQKAELSGRDYTARLQDSTVQSVVYTNSEISTIVKNIIDNNVNNITYSNVQTTSTTLSRIAFNQVSCYDAISQLANLAGYTFWVDNNKDLNFVPVESSSAGVTFDKTNIDYMKYDTTRQGMANKIWVYGDRYLDNYKETFTAGSPLGGSIFTLAYKPSNTVVTVSGAAIQPGAIEGMSIGVGSNVKYLVSYDDRRVTFTSGTTQGLNIPNSGNAVIVQYDRQLPIVKYGQNDASITAFGPKTKIINDKSIKDPNTAMAILQNELEDTDPFKEIKIESQGWYNVTPGQTVVLNVPNFSINSETMPVIEVDYHFTPETVNTSKIQSFRLNRKIFDITDEITNLKRRLDLIDAQDRQSTDLITRLQTTTGSAQLIGSYWEVRVCSNLGSSFILGNGIAGSNLVGSTLTGSVTGSVYSGLQFMFNFNSSGTSVHPDYGEPARIGSFVVGALGSSWTSGLIGSGITVMQGNYYFITSGTTSTQPSGLSVSIWVRPDLYVNTSGGIVTQGRNYGLQMSGGNSAYNNRYGFYVIPSGVNSAKVWALDPGSSAVGIWHHLVGTFDVTNAGSNVLFYKNGSLTSTAQSSSVTNLSGLTQVIGFNIVESTYISGARYDSFKFYNRAISLSEVQKLYNSGLGNEQSGTNWQNIYTNNYSFWGIGLGILGSCTGSYQSPPHYLGNSKAPANIIYSGGYTYT